MGKLKIRKEGRLIYGLPASAESYIAVAQSDASARVGVGLSIILFEAS